MAVHVVEVEMWIDEEEEEWNDKKEEGASQNQKVDYP